MLAGTHRGDAQERADQKNTLTDDDRMRMRQALALVRTEFGRAMVGLQFMTRVVVASVLLAIATAVVGGVLIQLSPWASLIPVASISVLVGLLIKIYQLARDQILLELVPSRYELAMEFCHTQQDAQDLISKFLEETTSFHSHGNT
jgi:hypothetical protein